MLPLLKNVLEDLKDEKHSVKFAFFIVKNLKSVKEEIESIQELSSQGISDSFKEYENKRVKLILENCERTKDGKPLVENNSFVVKEDKKEEVVSRIDSLREAYKESIEDEERRQKEFLEFLNEEYELPNKTKIIEEYLPENISGRQLSILMDCDLI
jgi:hypothetical protein